MSNRELLVILAKGSLVAFTVFWIFSLTGNIFFKDILQVNFESFRIFGGLIISFMSFEIIVKGRESIIAYSDDHSSISNQIAMPLMIGAGTISLSVIIGNRSNFIMGTLALVIVMVVNFLIIALLLFSQSSLIRYMKKDFDKYTEATLRLLSFFAGAIGIDMIVTGIQNLFS